LFILSALPKQLLLTSKRSTLRKRERSGKGMSGKGMSGKGMSGKGMSGKGMSGKGRMWKCESCGLSAEASIPNCVCGRKKP